VTDLQPVVEPASSQWYDMLDAYERSAQVYDEEMDVTERDSDQWQFALGRAAAFRDLAQAIRDEHRVALEHAGLVDEAMTTSARSLYATEKRFGVSDIGGCRRYVQLLIEDAEFTDPRDGFLAAYIGTAVGSDLELDYIRLRNQNAIAQMPVQVPVEVMVDGEVFVVTIPGHPDLVEPAGSGDSVIDYKTKDGLGVVIREDGERKHKYQVTLYAKGLIEKGVLSDKPRLALVYVDRSGAEERPHVVEWEYDEAIYEEAVEWLSDVVSATHHGEEASKDMPRQWCESYCPMFTRCRGDDTDVEGAIRNPEILAKIDLYDEARAEEKRWEKIKKAAGAELQGIAGHTPDGRTFRWVHVNETKVPTYVRRAYDMITLTKAKKGGTK
jgi:hypothetical protein